MFSDLVLRLVILMCVLVNIAFAYINANMGNTAAMAICMISAVLCFILFIKSVLWW